MITGRGRTAKASLKNKWQVSLALRTGENSKGGNVRWESTGHSQETGQFG